MRLFVAISHHGLGHLAQAAPVLNVLAARRPDLECIVQSGLDRAALAARIQIPFEHLREAADCGMAMHDALRVDAAASLDCYRAFHADWDGRVEALARRLRQSGATGVFSDVAYLPLAAARRAGLPSAALCSLNWADIAGHYLGAEPGMAPILAEMRAAYAGAELFLRPDPAMPMADLANAESVPPIAARGRERRAELRARLGLGNAVRLVLVGMGGLGLAAEVAHWPHMEGVRWLAPEAWCGRHPDFIPFATTGMAFADLLASCDALLTKPGYGSFVEAAAQGVPVLYLGREDWPETPWLTAWLHANGRALEVGAGVWENGGIGGCLEALWGQAPRPPLAAEGADAAARRLLALFV